MSVFNIYAMANDAANPGAPQRTKNTAEQIRITAQKALLKKPHQRRLLAASTRARPALNVMTEEQNTTREKVTVKLRVSKSTPNSACAISGKHSNGMAKTTPRIHDERIFTVPSLSDMFAPELETIDSNGAFNIPLAKSNMYWKTRAALNIPISP